MRLPLAFVALLIAAAQPAAAQPAAAQPADSVAVGLLDRAGAVTLTVNGGLWPAGAGVRVGLAHRVALDVALDRSVFAGSDLSTQLSPLVESGSRAWTLSATLDVAIPITDWFVIAQGVQVYAQRQADDVFLGYDGSVFYPVVERGGRETEGVGIAQAMRGEARVWGPLRVGFATNGFGLGVRRTRGGSVETTGGGFRLDPDARRTRAVLMGGSSRFYLGVRL